MSHNISLAIKETAAGCAIQEFRKHRGSLLIYLICGCMQMVRCFQYLRHMDFIKEV